MSRTCEVSKRFELQKMTAGIGRAVSSIRLFAGHRRLSHDHVGTVTSMQEEKTSKKTVVLRDRLEGK
jgi:hypothetical protein